MKKNLQLLLSVMLLSFNVVIGQVSSTSNYAVTTNTTSSLLSMQGSEELITMDVNNENSFVESTIFDFWFMGVRYNNFTANSNGLIRFGTTAVASVQTANGFPLSTNHGVLLAPFAGDLGTSSTGKVHSVINGIAPNRKCIIEFLNMELGNGSGMADGTFQVILNETTGVIQYIYGTMSIGNVAGIIDEQSVVIGFCSDSVNNKVLSLNHTTFAVNTTVTATKNSYSTTGDIVSLNSVADGSRRAIIFTPPVLNAPTAANFSGSTSSSVNLTWNQASVIGEQGFVIFKSDNGGITYDFSLQTGADATSATVNNLLAGTSYMFKICSVSEGALSTAITITGTTATCGASATNTLLLTTSGPFFWSTLGSSWSLGHIPTSCEDVVVNFNKSDTGNQVIVFIVDLDAAVKSLTINNISTSANIKVVNISGFGYMSVAGDIKLSCYGGNKFNRCAFSTQNKTVVNGNVSLSRDNWLQAINEGQCAIGSNGNSREQVYILKGNLTINKRGYTTDEHTNFTFDKAGIQYLYNFTTPQTYPYIGGEGDTLQPILFEKLVVGNLNATTLIFAGTGYDGYIEKHSREGVSIGVNSTLDLPENFSLNSLGGTSYFKMLNGAKLKIGGDQTISPNGIVYGVQGSNFPGVYFPYIFDATSTVEYYGSNSLTQTIYNIPNYANLIASNGPGSGRAQKITTAPLTIATSFNIKTLADVTLGTLGSATESVTCAGPLNIMASGGLYCNANVITGDNAFTMGNASYLGMGHAQGISNSGSATGNIQMTGARTYNTTANYIYNGIQAQITGAGLPSIINELTTDNPTIVTTANSQIVNGICLLKQGIFDIASTKITSNGATGILNSFSGKMKANLGIVEMMGTSGTPQNLAGSWFVNRNISTLINANTTGITIAPTINDTLLISSALVYGAVSSSVITTNDNLTLLSRDTATANFGEVKNGNSITGKVNVERYLPAVKSWRLLAAPVSNSTAPFVTSSWRECGNTASTGYGTRITGPATFIGMDEYTQRASMKYYNGVINNYIDVTNTNTTKISNTAGYYVFVRGDRNVAVSGAAACTILRIKGDIMTGDQIIPVTAGKFITFGNPYPSRIAIQALTKLNITDAVTVWNPKSAGLYYVGAFETYIWNGTNYMKPGGAIRNFIESGEAVFIQSNSAGAGSITINEAAKSYGSSVQSRSASTLRTGVTNPTLEINMYTKNTDGSTYLADGVWLNFDENYTDEIDNQDVRKISNSSDNFSIKNSAALLVVERRSPLKITDTIQLNLTNTRVNPYHFEIDPSVLNYPNLLAVFKDQFLNTETVLSLTTPSIIPFEVTADAASKAANRFMIFFKQIPMRFTGIAAERIKEKTVKVTWNVAYENNINYYTIEHSEDGINFNDLGTQMPTANNYGAVSYNFWDAIASIKNNWYRIKATAIMGAVQYSAIVKVNPEEAHINSGISIYPNPVIAGNINFNFVDKSMGDYQLQISNKMGQIILAQTISIQNKNVQKTVKASNLAPGTYMALIVDEAGKKTSLSFMVQ